MLDYRERQRIKRDLVQRMNDINSELRTLSETRGDKYTKVQDINSRLPHYVIALEETKDPEIIKIYQEPKKMLEDEKERLEGEIVVIEEAIANLTISSRKLENEIKTKYN